MTLLTRLVRSRPAGLTAADNRTRPAVEPSTASAPLAASRGPRRPATRPGHGRMVRPAACTRPGRPRPPGATTLRRVSGGRARTDRPWPAIGATLFPDGEPTLPDAMAANGERMDVRYVVGVLMGNRDLVRRLRAEADGVPAGTP